MKTPEDEAFDELATRQGSWGGGFPAKRKMAADKLQEPVCDKDPQGCWNVRCQLGKQCKNLAQPAQEPYDQTALELCNVCGWKTLIPDDCCLNCERAQPAQEPVAWALEWTFDGEEKGRRLYDDERHCKLDAENDGGICRPLGKQCKNLAQPAQEPVAWLTNEELTKLMTDSYDQGVKDALESIKEGLDALPKREWVGLTEEETSGFTSQEMTVVKYVSKVLQEKNT